MAAHGKRYNEIAKLVEPDKQYSVQEAAALVKKTATAKFDQTLEVHVRLGIDPRQSPSSLKVKKPSRQHALAQTRSVPLISSRRLMVDGWTLMLPSPRPT